MWDALWVFKWTSELGLGHFHLDGANLQVYAHLVPKIMHQNIVIILRQFIYGKKLFYSIGPRTSSCRRRRRRTPRRRFSSLKKMTANKIHFIFKIMWWFEKKEKDKRWSFNVIFTIHCIFVLSIVLWQCFFVGLAISRCLSTTPHPPMNRARG